MASLFKIDVKNLKGVGEKTAQYLNRLGVFSIGDLIKFYPRTYEDWTLVQTLAFAKGKKDQCLKLKILSNVISRNIRQGKCIYKLEATDGQNFVDIVFFNNKYTAESLKKGEEYLFRGNVTGSLLKFELISPKVKKIDDELQLYPVYNQTQGISSAKITTLVKAALEMLPEQIAETLPEHALVDNNLCSLDFAIRNIHFPKNWQSMLEARRRIVFEAFLIYQLGMNLIKMRARQKTEIKIQNDCLQEFNSLLPFAMTNAQKNAVKECAEDLKSGFSMNRLLQGDVGSGKTAVAAALAYMLVKNGYQVAIMAPTELLTLQHYKTFCDFFSCQNINVRALHSSMKTKIKKSVISEIEFGIADIVIGTHSLISDNVVFKNLGLIVTDEQHRFGVNQRSKLVSKGVSPHVLVMSATPIPRTLAMILYGDLDISVLNETLPGRQKIETFQIDSSKRARAWNFVRKILQEGGQAYVVCATIEESENGLADVTTYKEKMLAGGFQEDEIEILHGKMNPAEKDGIMSRFASGEIKVLVSTTVIEVGIDVPNARIILIENAERFGISQLHQLRGRVGRSSFESYCVLISDSKSKDAYRRFAAMTGSNDGFYLSEEDLKIRGPGDFFGVNQHGVPSLGVATSYKDLHIMKQAQNTVQKILSLCPDLSSSELKFIKSSVEKKFKTTNNSENQNIIF